MGSSPSVGTANNQVSRINFRNPTIGSTFAGTSNQSLHFDAATSTYEQIQLNMGQGYNNYQVSFDFYSSYLANSLYYFNLSAGTPQVKNFYFHGNGRVRYWGGADGSINGGTFANNTIYNVLLDYDLADNEVDVWLNGALLGTNAFNTSGDDIESFRFGLAPWHGSAGLDPLVEVNLDNILVTSRTLDAANVPEPGSLLLMFLGLAGLVSVRRVAS